MTQAATYTLETFVGDLKGVFASTTDPVARAEGVRQHLRRLMAVASWLEERLNLLPGAAR